MSKLGYDETNFTDAIVDLGRCENETKRLNDELKLLQETIDHLKQKELYLTNQLYILENENGIDKHLEYIETNWKKTPMDKAVASGAYREAEMKVLMKKHKFIGPDYFKDKRTYRRDPKAVKGAFDKNWDDYQENRFAPGSVSYMMAKKRFENNINKGGKTKNKKVRKQFKTKKYKLKNRIK